jgi:hypothetical protein
MRMRKRRRREMEMRAACAAGVYRLAGAAGREAGAH